VSDAIPLILVVAAITSAVAVGIGARRRRAGVGVAIGAVLEVVGATVLFFVANLLVGAALVLIARRFTPYYTTLYEVTDLALLVLSLLQALTFTAWHRRG
jgi:fructose-specific phosphotransferase system IIC component